MPLRLPKALARRRSAGNLLDNVEEPVLEHSFKVLARQEAEDYTFSGGLELRRKNDRRTFGFSDDYGQGYDSVLNVGHDGWNNNSSISIGAASSARGSNVSTQPSSLESLDPPQDDHFTNRPSSVPLPQSDITPSHKHKSTFGAWTGPKVFQFRPKAKESIDNLVKVADMNNDYTPLVDQAPTDVWDIRPYTEPDQHPVKESNLNQECFVRHLTNIGEAPSQDLYQETPKRQTSNLLPSDMYTPTSDIKPLASQQSYNSHNLELYKTHSWETDESRALFSVCAKNPHHDSVAVENQRSHPSDNPTQVVIDALYASQILDQQHGRNLNGSNHTERSHVEAENRQDQIKKQATTMDQFAQNHPKGDPTLSQNKLTRTDRPPLNPRTSTFLGVTNRAMTPAQFEEYKKEKQRAHAIETGSITSEESITYDDDDEAEREKEIARQRRKQEAHMAVHRQQMMKVTGELPSAPRIALNRASRSTPELSISFAEPGTVGERGVKSSDDEDDEDIPLGILQAHGFPNKNRPPTQTLTPESAHRLSSYPSPAGATRNDAASGGGGSLPEFARNLPLDPYIGANLVKIGDRESLAFSRTVTNVSIPPNLTFTTQSANGLEVPRQTSPMKNLPAGGLVGVIANEEFARAMRSRSPNGLLLPPQNTPLSQPTPVTPSISTPGIMYPLMPMNTPLQSPMSAAEQSQVQVNNSMTQMMQLQMQWMQQMMVMQGLPPHEISPATNLNVRQQGAALSRPNKSPYQRPYSMAVSSPPAHDSTNHTYNTHRRGMSTLSVPLNMGRGESDYFGMLSPLQPIPQQRVKYATSIAPSERSNASQPSRYRPVTGSTPSSDASRPGVIRTFTVPVASGVTGGMMHGGKENVGDVRTRGQPVQPCATGDEEEEEEEEGWRQFKREREERMQKRRANRRVESAVEVLGVADVNIG